MSAISDYGYYVHYYASNFVKKTSVPGGNALSNYAIQKTKARIIGIKSGVSQGIKQKYANTISNLYGRNLNEDASLSSSDRNKMHQILENWMDEELHLEKNARIIDRESGRIVQGNASLTDTLKTQMKKEQSGGAIGATRFVSIPQINNIKNIINELQRDIVIATQTNRISQSELKDIENDIQTILTNLNKIESEQKNKMKTLSQYLGKFAENIPGANTVLRYDLGQANSQLLKKINIVLKYLHMQYGVMTTAQGMYAEGIAAMAAEMCAGLAIDHINKDLLNQLVVGKNKPYIQWLHKGIPSDVYAKILMQDSIERNGYVTVSKKASQQKIDVEATLPTDESMKGFKKVNISVKSYDLSRDLGMVSGTPLFYLLHNEDHKIFLRPYLNIMANRQESLERIKRRKNHGREDVAAVALLSGLRENALLATKILVAYKAITGDTFGRNAAQLLVVNDVATKKTYVLEIADIIRAMLSDVVKNPYSINNYFSFDGADTIGDLLLKNEWQKDGYDARMVKLLQDLHAKKMTVHLRNTVITGDLMRKSQIITA